ncbi:Na+/H+ antiporter NhaA [Actinopolymorpha pittospori]|uniref:Na(+)/H(+) antiporter NhaA n=1 Tax=Actinopolymorpha pittospori TaxID=648752 RepID=A0A927R972_9ACTN|nr:Na+/H+ antiporter NhaA [Actinopolymorpha pittospori]
MSEPEATGPLSTRTAWARSLPSPLRDFLQTETGSAAILLLAAVAALVWTNVDSSSYSGFWTTNLSIAMGDGVLGQDLRGWVNNGLMTFFFFVFGLEARREFDMGELRDRRRLALPLLAGVAGLIVPVLIYLALNAGRPSAQGWGIAMSTDTAFALGVLALVGPRFPARLRAFMLTIFVVDDICSLGVITLGYTRHINVAALLTAVGIFAVALLVRSRDVRIAPLFAVFGVAIWVALFYSGVDPVVVGLIMGLLIYAYPASRVDLERASDLFRLFREQPTPELARSARVGVRMALSPNERLQHLYHPWTSYLIVPLFALANAGITISPDFLLRSFTSPITLGILIGYVIGKPVGVTAVSGLVTWVSRGRLRPPVGWAAVLGGGAVAGVGFTLSLLIATLAFRGQQLEEAKLGIISAALVASVLGWTIFRIAALLPQNLRLRALLGAAETIVDLATAVDPRRDHIRGPANAPVTLVEYGDFECPNCGQAEPIVRDLLADYGDVRYVWRHLPLTDVHPNAQLAAEASEAASKQGAFWGMHDLLLDHQGNLKPSDLLGYAEQLDLDLKRFRHDLRRHAGATRVAEDIDSADLSDVSGTPTFFVNGRRHHGAYDIDSLSTAVRAARGRAKLQSS